MDKSISIGEYIKKRREELSLKQTDVISVLRSSGIETSQPAYSRFENGENQKFVFDPGVIPALSRALRISSLKLLEATGILQLTALTANERSDYFVETFGLLDTDQRDIVITMMESLLKQSSKRNQD